jgi:imidazolonepropionase-like amidohydrolase
VSAGRLVVHSARLIDGTGTDPVEDGVLVAIDGVIEFAGPREQSPPVENARILDAGGKTLIPGLIDAHVHLTADAWPDFEGQMRAQTLEEAIEVGVRSAKAALKDGITTVRDLGGRQNSVLQVVEQSKGQNACRIVASGTWLTRPKGHVHYAGREVSSPPDGVRAVEEQFEMGARTVKIVATGGVLSSGMAATQTAFDDETLQAMVDHARNLGMRVAAHAIGAAGIEQCLRAGVDSIEHGSETSKVDRALFANQPTWLVPTFNAPDGICSCEQIPDYAREKAQNLIPAVAESFRLAVQDGVRVAAGTDAGTPENPIGDLWRELATMIKNGLAPMRALQAATVSAAQLLGVGDIGTLETGKRADAVLLDGDPLTDSAAYTKVSHVIFDGALVD